GRTKDGAERSRRPGLRKARETRVVAAPRAQALCLLYSSTPLLLPLPPHPLAPARFGCYAKYATSARARRSLGIFGRPTRSTRLTSHQATTAMGYSIDVALRYLGSKKRAFISVGTAFAILGVTLGVAALATVMSVTGGFQAQFREKVLGVNAHVLVLKYSTDLREYRSIMEQDTQLTGVEGTAPFSINPMMLTHGDATATGVLLKGVDPAKSLGIGEPPGTKPVLILPQQIVGCEEAAKQGLSAAIACGQSKLV